MLTDIDKSKFAEAKIKVLGEFSENGGIGTLAEKALHRILKYYIEPDESCHEVKILGSVADVKNGEGIFEIQTRRLSALRPKLEKFLSEYKVTVIYPMPYEKHITLIDGESGEFISRRKSPKKSTAYDALYELYNLKDLLGRENLSVAIMLLNVDEYRYTGGRHFGRKSRSTRIERIPNSIERVYLLRHPEDYKTLFTPDGLDEEFTAGAYGRAVSKSFKHGYSGVALLEALGVLQSRKQGRIKLYKIKQSD
jgi:hypothetical protein